MEKKGINTDSLKQDQKELIKNRLIFKKQQRFKSVRYNVFTEEIRKIALGSMDNKRVQSINLVEKYPHGMSKDIIWMKGKTNNLI